MVLLPAMSLGGPHTQGNHVSVHQEVLETNPMFLDMRVIAPPNLRQQSNANGHPTAPSSQSRTHR